ncbi:MAG: M48 family metalloprotease [Planctomycetota bacterium]
MAALLAGLFADMRVDLGLGAALAIMGGLALIYAVITARMLALPIPEIPEDPTACHERRIRNLALEVALLAGIEPPRIHLLREDGSLNAWTMGVTTGGARVVITGGIANDPGIPDEEIRAILAHEAAHIRHGDFTLSSLLRFPVWCMQQMRWQSIGCDGRQVRPPSG